MNWLILPSLSQVKVGQGAPARGFFVEAMNRQDGKELINGPGIGHGLKHRQVDVVNRGHALVEFFDVFGHKVGFSGNGHVLYGSRPKTAVRLWPVLRLR
jgi:hypothetical protein